MNTFFNHKFVSPTSELVPTGFLCALLLLYGTVGYSRVVGRGIPNNGSRSAC